MENIFCITTRNHAMNIYHTQRPVLRDLGTQKGALSLIKLLITYSVHAIRTMLRTFSELSYVIVVMLSKIKCVCQMRKEIWCDEAEELAQYK